MPMITDRTEPEFWYCKAEEAKVKAELLKFEEPRTTMLKLAEHYEKLGDLAAERIANALPRNKGG